MCLTFGGGPISAGVGDGPISEHLWGMGLMATPVVWTSLVGVTAVGNSLTKTAVAGWGNAGAVSVQQLASGDGYVEITASETIAGRMFGLSCGNTDANYTDIDFAMFMQSGGNLSVYEAGVSLGLVGAYITGNTIRVAVEGGVVKYYKNGALFYTSLAAPTYPLLVDTALLTQGATINSAVVSGGTAWRAG